MYEDETVDSFCDLKGALIDDYCESDTELGLKEMTRQVSDLSEMSIHLTGEESARNVKGVPMIRQTSNLSDIFISSTPDAERYFSKQAEHLYDRAVKGELDIEVASTGSSLEEKLVVKPMEDEMEIVNLYDKPSLTVQPVEKSDTVSSFEGLYDEAELEKITAEAQIGKDDLQVGDKFQGTLVQPVVQSSYENLYTQEPSGLHLPKEGEGQMCGKSVILTNIFIVNY